MCECFVFNGISTQCPIICDSELIRLLNSGNEKHFNVTDILFLASDIQDFFNFVEMVNGHHMDIAYIYRNYNIRNIIQAQRLVLHFRLPEDVHLNLVCAYDMSSCDISGWEYYIFWKESKCIRSKYKGACLNKPELSSMSYNKLLNLNYDMRDLDKYRGFITLSDLYNGIKSFIYDE